MMPISRRRFLAAAGAAAHVAAAGRLAAAPPAPGPDPLAAGNTAFGMDLYGQLRGDAGNLFLSPFSISTALAMTAAGARGATRDEMAKVLRLPENASAAFGLLLAKLNDTQPPEKRGFQLSAANALWAQQGYPWRPEYQAVVQKDFQAGLHSVDFKGSPDAARGVVNTWVAKQTADKIQDLLPQGSVTPDTRLVLTNAVYFKGDWQTPFRKDATQDQPFRLAAGGTVDAPLMFRKGGFAYAESDAVQAVELPYKGNRLGMVVLLPREPNGLPALEKTLTGEALTKTLAGLRYEREVLLHLPRFKAEKAFNLNKPLVALGMAAAFSSDADFGGMTAGGEKLSITDVVHKAFVDVNEQGTEAAAATGVVVGVTSAPLDPPKPKVFRADRPFLFLIRDRQTDTVLFLGRVTNPKG